MPDDCVYCVHLEIIRGVPYCRKSGEEIEEFELLDEDCRYFRSVPEACVDCAEFCYNNLEDEHGNLIDSNAPFCEDFGDFLVDEDWEYGIPDWCDFNVKDRLRKLKFDAPPATRDISSLKSKMKEKYWLVTHLGCT